MKNQISFTIKCNKDEKEKIALLCSQLKSYSKERVAEVIIKALEKLKEEK